MSLSVRTGDRPFVEDFLIILPTCCRWYCYCYYHCCCWFFSFFSSFVVLHVSGDVHLSMIFINCMRCDKPFSFHCDASWVRLGMAYIHTHCIRFHSLFFPFICISNAFHSRNWKRKKKKEKERRLLPQQPNTKKCSAYAEAKRCHSSDNRVN